jgi:formylmethanofuran dehydrogenase subunit E
MRGGRGVRALLRPEARDEEGDELARLMALGPEADAAARQRMADLRQAMQQRYMALELEELFRVAPADAPPPRPPRILQSLACEACGENVMESRTRRFAGRTLCIPCFGAVEQKV